MKANLSYLSSDVDIEGCVTCEGPVRIDGICRGTIDGKNSITLGTPAQVYGTIRAQSLVINGQVQGDLISSGKISILSQGSIAGNIYTPAGGVSIAKGGNLEGSFLIDQQPTVLKSEAEPSSSDTTVPSNGTSDVSLTK